MPTPVAIPASDRPPRGTPATAPTPVASRATDPTTPAALTAASAPPPTTAAASRGFRSRAFPTEASALPACRGDRVRPVGELTPEPGRGRSGGAGCGDHGGGPVAGVAHVLPGLGEEPLCVSACGVTGVDEGHGYGAGGDRLGVLRAGRRRRHLRLAPANHGLAGPTPRPLQRGGVVVGGAGGVTEGCGGVLPASGLGGERGAETVRRRPGPALPAFPTRPSPAEASSRVSAYRR